MRIYFYFVSCSLAPNPQFYFLRGTCNHHCEQFSNCIRDYKTTLELWMLPTSPTSPLPIPPQLYITYGSALFHMGEYDESVAQYCTAIGHSPSSLPTATSLPSPNLPRTVQAEAMFGIGRSLLFSGRSEEAMLMFQLALQQWPAISAQLELLQNHIAQMGNAL
jgi:tetratricopeptide (TPR) repeat protein